MDKKKLSRYSIPTPFLFIISILIITYFFPREGEFGYSYEEGKPWRYGLLTAPMNFPIYKSEVQLEKERDSIMTNYLPYYIIDNEIQKKAIADFERDTRSQHIPESYIRYVKAELSDIYNTGIISPEDYERIKKTKSRQLRLINDNVATGKHVSSFLTSRSAYEKVITDLPDNLEEDVLKSLNLNNYLYNNILYDSETSTKSKDEMLQQVSPAQGMVQSGEKIIDRGEIITPKIYSILSSLEKSTEELSNNKNKQNWVILGDLILVAVFIFSFMTYLIFFRPREYKDRKNSSFMLLMITLFCVLTGITVDNNLFNIYIIPYAIPTIMIRTFIDSRTAMTTHMIMSMICASMVPFPSEFLILQIPVGFMCIFSLRDLSERSQLIKSSFFILITYIVVYIGYTLSQEGGFIKGQSGFENSREHWLMLIYFGINFIFVMFTYSLVYLCEKAFGFISGVSMIELSNTNKPLLQRLSEVAPGTFQHSTQVSNLAASVAVRIGANAPLVKTGSLYHDIGKMTNPIYFTENQAPGLDPHKNLSYKESAKIIIGHVEEGIRIAKKYNLPQQIIDFIATHHGTGKAKFFYNSYKNEHPDEEVDESDFTYPGPNPFSKETAIVMMADTVEAASRSLKEYSEETISNLVEKLIDAQVTDGLLKNAPITFKDIQIAKEIFKDKLMTIYHTRITYPELNKEEVKA